MIIKRIYAILLHIIEFLFGSDIAKKFDAKLRFNKTLNMKNPQNLAEKVSYIELHQQSDLAGTCTDKYAVRNYVKEKGYGDSLVPLVGGPWNDVNDIPFQMLEMPYVLKATHGCKMNYFVLSKDQFDYNDCKKTLNKWLDVTYGTYSMEPHYKNIPHRIYAEKYLGDMSTLLDYKFHCINGEPEFILVTSNRTLVDEKYMQVTLDLFDKSWKPIFALKDYKLEKRGNGTVPKPHNLEGMIRMARDLSKDFKFVRVDLYELNGRVMFGELTFSPACCVFPYFKDEFLLEMGKKLDL